MKKYKKYIYVLIIVFLTLGIILYKLKQTPVTVNKILEDKIDITSDLSPIKTENPEITKILKEYSQTLQTNLKKLDINDNLSFLNSSSMTWTGPDHFSILIENSPSVKLEVSYCDDTLTTVKSKIISPIEEVLLQNGYKKSNSDSRTNYYDTDIYGYEKGNIKCEFIITSNCSSSIPIYFTCSDQYQKYYQAQTKILKDLNVKDEVVLLNKSVIEGNYAFFDLFHTGAYAMMDSNGKWNLLYRGNDSLPCDVAIKNKVPKKIASECYSNDTLIPNPIK